MPRQAGPPTSADAVSTEDIGDQQRSKRPRHEGAPAADARDGDAEEQQHVASPATGPAPDDVAAAGNTVSAYELERQRIMARNQARLEALQLPQLVSAIAAEAAAAKAARKLQRTEKRPKPPRSDPSERRTSMRLRGVRPEGTTAAGVDREARNGRIILAHGTGSIWDPTTGGGGAAAAANGDGGGGSSPEPQRRHPRGPLAFASAGGDADADARFLELLRSSAAAEPAPAAAGHRTAAGAGGGGGAAAVARLQLRAEDVAKLTKDAVTCLAFCPWAPRPLLAAADKTGHLSLWDVDGGGGGAVDAGILSFAPHSDFISGLRWAPGCRLWTCSYDGSLRVMDPAAGAFLQLEVPGLEEGMGEFSALEVSSDGSTLFLASPEGEGAIVDVRSAALVASGIPFATRKVNTLSLEPGTGHLLASASTDGQVAIFDTRRLPRRQGSSSGGGGVEAARAAAAAPLAVCAHAKSSQGATWAPDGSRRLLTVSFDDTLRVWAPTSEGGAPGGGGAAAAWTQQLMVKHNNNTGRWVTPFRPAFAPAADCFVVGSMKRAVDVFDAASGRLAGSLSNEAMTAIPSRFAFGEASPGDDAGAARLLLLAAATSSGRVHIYR